MRVINDGPAVVARSPAKLNLLLAIRSRRADGYHELETLMVKVSLFDTIRFSLRTDGRVSLRVRQTSTAATPAIPTGPQNLVIRAAELLQREVGIRSGADVLLTKTIPAEAGLAGGSGNAAAALAGLNRLWQLGLDTASLVRLGGQLGSDVPFFLSGSNAAVARGRGEQIEPIRIAGPLHAVIVKPPVGLSTADVYRTFAERFSPSCANSDRLAGALASGQRHQVSRFLQNDLIAAAEYLRPELRSLRKRLQTHCRYGVLMTGSGSASFGLCSTSREAARAAARLRAARIGQVFAVTSA